MPLTMKLLLREVGIGTLGGWWQYCVLNSAVAWGGGRKKRDRGAWQLWSLGTE